MVDAYFSDAKKSSKERIFEFFSLFEKIVELGGFVRMPN